MSSSAKCIATQCNTSAPVLAGVFRCGRVGTGCTAQPRRAWQSSRKPQDLMMLT